MSEADHDNDILRCGRLPALLVTTGHVHASMTRTPCARRGYLAKLQESCVAAHQQSPYFSSLRRYYMTSVIYLNTAISAHVWYHSDLEPEVCSHSRS